MTDAQFASLSSLYVIGALLGALCAGPVSSRWGRVWPLRGSTGFFILGSSLATVAGSLPVMCLGRFLSGIGAGMATVIVPLYISEMAPPQDRGLFGALTQISTNTGIITAQTLGYFLSQTWHWRIILVTGAGLGVLQALGLSFVSESPAWLARNQQSARAVELLQKIRGPGSDISEEIKEWDVAESGSEEDRLLQTENLTSNPTTSKSLPHVGFLGVLRDPLYRPAVIAVIGIMFAQQLTGINSIIMYSVSLLSGVLPVSSSLLTIILSLCNLIVTILCAPLPDKIGRKPCLLISITGMGCMALILAIAMRVHLQLLSALSVVGFVIFFATGLGPVPFLIAPELVGQEAVSAISSWSLAANYLSTFIVAQFFPMINTALNNWLGGRGWVFFGFVGLALAADIFVCWWVPETKGRRDADEVWGRTRRED